MLKRDVKIGEVYKVKLSTGRIAKMRVISWYEGWRPGAPGKFRLVDVDKPTLTKWCSAARLIGPVV